MIKCVKVDFSSFLGPLWYAHSAPLDMMLMSGAETIQSTLGRLRRNKFPELSAPLVKRSASI